LELRLQVFLARAGAGSRRRMERAMAEGRVTVDGRLVKEMGVKVDPERAVVALDGRTVQLPTSHTYVILNKPRGVLSTARDHRGRRTVVDLLPARLRKARLYPVGRLDLDSDGLILMTDHGELAHRLTHPRFQHEREYRVIVSAKPNQAALDRLNRGIKLEDGMTAPATVELLEGDGSTNELRVVLREGKKRQIRRMLSACGLRAVSLRRIRLGGIELGELGPSQARELNAGERRRLLANVGM
jgi:23S rRNA pseudouridine2605 synthase